MTETIMQCCYTNAVREVGGRTISGWQTVAVSDNLPPDAYNKCVKLQGANSTIQTPMMDERGNVLNLLEITGDGAYVYVSRTQYGLRDRLGRPNMFSHAYIFPWKQEEVIGDPNTFLTLDRTNFTDNEADAVNTRALTRRPPFTLRHALEMAGLEAGTYLTLIRCVYAQYAEHRAAKPLYIQYDGTETQLQAILYGIYCGIPRYMRRNLSAASAESNTTGSKNLIFSENATSHETYVVPQTGENNILTARTEKKIDRYGFVDHAARQLGSIDAEAYFVQLERLAVDLGDPTASNELILKIAHRMMTGEAPTVLSDEELSNCLSDALRSRSLSSRLMAEYISDMLDEIRSRGLFLTEENEADLTARLAEPATERFAAAGEAYTIYRINALPTEAAVKMLANWPRGVFEKYCHSLAESENGPQLLDLYYAEYAFAEREVSWQTLHALLDETNFLMERPKTLDLIDAKAWELYNSRIKIKGEVVPAFQELIHLMCELYGSDMRQQYEQTAREAYWEDKSFDSFSYAELDEYKTMSDGSEKCYMFACLYAVLDAYKLKGDEEFLTTLNAFFRKFKQVLDRESLSVCILRKVTEEAGRISGRVTKLVDWVKVAAMADTAELYSGVQKVRSAFQQRDYTALIRAYQSMADASGYVHGGDALLRRLSVALTVDCSCADHEQEPVPIDLWLLLGTAQYANAFHIFEALTRRPCILNFNEAAAVAQSTLLGENVYHEQAEDYIQNKGAEAKTVRKWLGEWRAVERRNRAENKKKVRGEDEGSLLDRGISFFSRIVGGEETEPAQKAPHSARAYEWTDATEAQRPDRDRTKAGAGSRTVRDRQPDVGTVSRRGGTNAPADGHGPDENKSAGKKGLFKDLFGRK